MADDGSELAQVQGGPLAALGRMALPVEVRIGTVSLTIGELLRMRAGSVVTLDRRTDEPVELLVGERPVARAELVAIDGGPAEGGSRLGVRITEIIGEAEEAP